MKRIFFSLFLAAISPSLCSAQLKTLSVSGNSHTVNAESIKVPLAMLNPKSDRLISSAFSPTSLNGIWVKSDGGSLFFQEVHKTKTQIWLKADWTFHEDNTESLEKFSESVFDQLATAYFSKFGTTGTEFGSQDTDDNGISHIRHRLRILGLPLRYDEMILHIRAGQLWVQLPLVEGSFDSLSGRTIDSKAVEKIVKAELSKTGKWKDVTDVWDRLGMQRFECSLLWDKDDAYGKYTQQWEVRCSPNLTESWVLYVDAKTGIIHEKYKNSCQLYAGPAIDDGITEANADKMNSDHESRCVDHFSFEKSVMVGPEEADAVDLLGQTRRLKVYQEGGLYYLIDASRSMFQAQSSQLPDDPIGVIWTIDAQNTSPTRNDFTIDHVRSSNNSWTDRGSVSAHYNGAKAYEYFNETFGRNSINGLGGNIVSLINVSEEDGGEMDNAFWNGAAIFYGNGRQAFLPLARGLDVAGHEMSHGVIQHTANLEYQGESGAMNEAYADIFGAMVDRDDWKIGEDVVRTSSFPSGALRDMSDPHNGGNGLADPGWQPKHYSERYQGAEDNGGVHINSGIINHAYFLFASDVGKSKAEQVFYYALSNYLTKSSQFVDLRIAVESTIVDLYGANDDAIQFAEQAFDAVGIPSNGGGGSQGKVPVNPGEDLILFTTSNYQNLYVATAGGQLIFNPLTQTDPISKPSITDNGSAIVFVGSDGHIHVVYIDWNSNQVIGEDILSVDPIWRNVAVAKDGSLIAAMTDDGDNKVHVFSGNAYREFELYNPTFTQGVNTGDVLFADAIEFDLTGEYIMYDAFNRLPQSGGGGIEYWDIGFIHVWDRISDTPANGHIEKLFAALPEGISIGNPSFSKNAPFVICFDQLEEGFFGDEYYIRAANLEKNELGVLFQNSVIGYPNYSRTDEYVIFNASATSGQDVIGYVPVSESLTQPAGNAAVLFEDVSWGVWFSNETRDLQTSTNSHVTGKIQIYPNPSTDEIYISLDVTDWTVNRLEIYEMNGRLVKSQAIEPGRQEITTSVSSLNPGMYYVTLWSGSGQSTQHLIVVE